MAETRNDNFRLAKKTPILRVGTRSSRLALAQVEIVRQRLASIGIAIDVVELETLGDRDQRTPISGFATASPFTDDIEVALLRGNIDIAVHSLKDMPLVPTTGLGVAAILERGDARESLVTANGLRFTDLPAGAVIGTSCARRSAQIRHLRRDLRTASIRGPVDDRIRQVREGRFDAALLAIAGLQRSGLADAASEVFPISTFVPAPAQAALAIQVRVDDVRTCELTSKLDHAPTRDAVATELRVLAAFDERKDITVAAYAQLRSNLQLRVRVMRVDGRPLLETVISGRDCNRVADTAIRRINDVVQIRKVAG